MEVIRGLRARTQLGQIDGQADRQAKQIDGLIEKMRSQIVPDAAPGACLLAPAVTHLRTETVKMRLKESNFAE
ncbi:hypothetical protein D3C78_1945090 [compost metagenome]